MRQNQKQVSGGSRLMAAGKTPMLLGLTPEERAKIQAAAQLLGIPMTRLVTQAALRAADELLRGGQPDGADTYSPDGDAVTELERMCREQAAETMAVYFIQQAPSGPVKIGIAKDPAARLRELQTGAAMPLVLLGAIPGNRRLEVAIQGTFLRARLCGEWFRPCETLLQFVRHNVHFRHEKT